MHYIHTMYYVQYILPVYYNKWARQADKVCCSSLSAATMRGRSAESADCSFHEGSGERVTLRQARAVQGAAPRSPNECLQHG